MLEPSVRAAGSGPAAWKIHDRDNVAVALADLKGGEAVEVAGERTALRSDIPRGHKFALGEIMPGDPVRRYGEQIGLASQQIGAGEHVHSHNLKTALAGELNYSDFEGEKMEATPAAPLCPWLGYRRPDGRYATRNEIWVLPTVGCVSPLADMVAREASALHADRVDAVVAFGHPHGCSQLSEDLAGTRAVLAALCDNPNAGGVVLVGLGCESNQLDELVGSVPERSRAKLRSMRAQDVGDERKALLGLIAELVEKVGDQTRVEAPSSALCIGLKCGGSDALSGVTANPLLGRFSNRVDASEGRLVLTEIPEIFGAERSLFARSETPEVLESAGALLNRFKRYFLENGQAVSENPSPGNIAGGITTLEEKSLGAVQKAGRARLSGVIDYGGLAETAGITLLEAPGNDAVSSTALAAAGATLILFTTGRGTPLGFPVPTVKVSSNSQLAASKSGWIDFDAGRMLTEDPDRVADDFADYLLEVASGQETSAERSGQRVISIWKRGVTL
ncbi:altronate dehydratase family protein [Erythrobacteraceae bacterium WH01K]|nr:altronate dehydratase family protein [Erythrobacteraceae bacterium WH01K]